MPATTITLPAFAKINLTLRVLGKRADGYHEIDTLLQTISLHDTLTITATADSSIKLSCDDHSIPCDEQNLVWRAAAAVQKYDPEKRGAHIRLEKRIPAQAGLGGGSSDAAVTLFGLTHFRGLDIARDALFEIAEILGADVPFFLIGGAVRGTGTGKTVSTLPDGPEIHLLVLKPNAGVATAKAYALVKSPALTTSESKIILSSSRAADFSGEFVPEVLHNDFEPVILQLEPEIGRAKVALLKSGARAAMLSGSGSAVFGIFDNQDAQERAIQAIELETGWRAFPCKTVGRSHYRRAWGQAGR